MRDYVYFLTPDRGLPLFRVKLIDEETPAERKDVVAEVVASLPEEERVLGLDRVLASLDKSQILSKNAEGVKADPPRIFYSERPAVLVNVVRRADLARFPRTT